MQQIKKSEDWAKEVFGNAELGDKRLTNRLVSLSSQLSKHTGKSIVQSCEGDSGKLEGSYRFIRNDRVKAEQIAEAAFQSTARHCQVAGKILALEDSTTLSYSHQVRKELGDLGGSKGSKKRGYWVHNVLALDAETELIHGLLEQSYWLREPESRGKASKRQKRDYEDKESFKWQNASERVEKRLGTKMKDVISVCDREADIYEYLSYKIANAHGYVVRASWDRRVDTENERLYQEARKAPVLGCYQIQIPQKGGRKARKAKLELKAVQVKIKPPSRLKSSYECIEVNLVIAQELTDKTNDGLCWMLFTSEPIVDFMQARQVTRYYELRWRVEDFHKAWKSSGTDVEELRLQDKENIQRVAVIMACVAVRLMQMREIFHRAKQKSISVEIPCDRLLETQEWQVLWMADKKIALPEKIPSVVWAYEAIARLGGWIDTKRTGIVGWSTLWQGWYRLQDKVDGMMIAQSLNKGCFLK